MDCMTPSMEETLATTLRNFAAFSDLLDNGKSSSSDRIEDEPNHQPIQQQPQQKKIESISKSSLNYCSPYDSLYWLGGDCIRGTTSLATIEECHTMKIDNTTTLTSDAKANARAASPESPVTKITASEESLPEPILQTPKKSNSKPATSPHDIISEYRNHNSNSNALFDDYRDYMDYNDPLNSLIIDDYADESNTYGNSRRNNNDSIFKVKSKPEPDELASPTSITSWCGGYPSLLMQNGNDETESQKHPEYYAEFRPQRQFAFDEGDSNDSGSSITPTRDALNKILMDDVSTVAETIATVNDADSLVTGASSVQSFMVISRPHTSNINTTLTRKLQRGSSRKTTHDFDRHLHQLISTPTRIRNERDNETNHHQTDHALSQHLMRKLQKYLPYGKRGDSFWLQYSLLRDGASLDSLLDMVHKNKSNTNSHICSVLAIETVEGEVFGAFLTQTWRRSNKQWYGGGQSFLWATYGKERKKMRVFPYSFENSYVQLCDRERLLVGGGDSGDNFDKHCYGFGLALERDLMRGSSCPCSTFNSPSLSKLHSDGSSFEIRNVEVWTLTPCLSVIENPSEGLVRVHKKEVKKKRHKSQFQKDVSSSDSDDLDDFHSCIDRDVEDMGSSFSSFPGINQAAVDGRQRTRYVLQNPSM